MIAALALIAAADPAAFLAAVRAQDQERVERMLAQDPGLASAHDEKGTAVTSALQARRGEGFVPRRENRVLEALLRRSPQLTPWEVFAVGNAQQVRAQIASTPALVKERSKLGWTPLHYAAFTDNAAAVALILAAGGQVDARAKNKFENTPLQVAMLTGSVESAKVLLAHGADVNARYFEGITALHEAASSGDLPSIRMLLAAGADTRAVMQDGRTPAELARANKHEEAARALSDGAAANR